VAKTGEEAIDIVKEKILDIVIMDVKLPVLSGIETFLAIKKINPRISCIFITGFPEEMKTQIEEIRQGGLTCLYKPIKVEKILQIIEKISNGSKY
jgi:two-component system nitrogen regulation response regulator GlnG